MTQSIIWLTTPGNQRSARCVQERIECDWISQELAGYASLADLELELLFLFLLAGAWIHVHAHLAAKCTNIFLFQFPVFTRSL